MSTANTNDAWVTTWDRSGRIVQVYDPTATKLTVSTQQPEFTDNKSKKA